MSTSNTKGKVNTLTILAAIGGLAVGLVTGMAVASISQNTPVAPNNTNPSISQIDESIFNDQSALLSAKVKSISPTSLTIEKADNKEATFPLTDKVFISKQPSSPNSPAAKASVNDIKTGDFLIINLKKVGGEYQVYSIVIPPPLGSPPPLPKPVSPRPSASSN
jgi:hypothetical protein